MAVLQTAFTRYLLCIPLFLPSVALFTIEKMRMLPKSFAGRTSLELVIIAFELYFAAAFAIAFFP